MRKTVEYGVLILVILGLVLYLFARRSDNTHYELPRLPQVDGKEITKLVISHDGTEKTIVRGDDGWYLDPRHHRADSTVITRMVDFISGLTLTALVSESRSYERYKLDDAAMIRVIAWSGNDVARRFDMGEVASTYQHTYVRLPDDPRVYHARGSARADFERSASELRDKLVFAVNGDAVTRIALVTKKGKTVITRTTPSDEGQGTESVWTHHTGNTVKADAVSELLTSLAAVHCDSFGVKKGDVNVTVPRRFRITLTAEDDHILDIFFPESQESNTQLALSSQIDDAFYVTGWKVASIASAIKDIVSESP